MEKKVKTGVDFREAVRRHKLETFEVRHCSICGTPVKFLFKDNHIFFDGSCSCAKGIPQERSWDELAEMYNRNIDNPLGNKIATYFKFE